MENVNVNQLAQEIEKLKGVVNQLIDHLTITRESVVMQSETLPFILYQHKSLALEMAAQGKLLTEIQEALISKDNGYQNAMRELSRTAEEANILRRYVDAALKNYKSLEDRVAQLKEQLHRLQLQLKAKDAAIQGFKKILTEITKLLEQPKTPVAAISELKQLLQQELEQPPPAPTLPEGEGEVFE